MLKQRIITAAVLLPLVVLAVFLLPSEYFALVFGLITLLAAWEWLNLAGIESPIKRGLFLSSMMLVMVWMQLWTQFLELLATIFDYPDIRDFSGAIEWLVVPPVIFWILVMVLIRNAPAGLLKLELKTISKGLIGWFILLAAWMFFSRMHLLFSPPMVMYLLVLIWAADISAYFVGKKWGETKLAPEISPGKTVAGFYGALASGFVSGIVLVIALVLYKLNNDNPDDNAVDAAFLMIGADLVLLSILTVLVSIYGDLFFSLAKRIRGVKDTGALLPGHGGILDRIDSLIAAAPFFYAGLTLIYRQIS